MIKNFYSLTKPGIVYGNLVTAIGGFFLGSRGVVINYFTLLATLLGIALIIACGCVFNNYIDRDIDGLMKRTQNRVLVKELISGKTAIIYAVILGALGLILLLWQTNLLTVSVALVGLFVYVVLYSLLFKRNSIHGTIIGSISGAVPVLVKLELGLSSDVFFSSGSLELEVFLLPSLNFAFRESALESPRRKLLFLIKKLGLHNLLR